MNDFADRLSECHDCGLVQSLPPLRDGAVVMCRRCDSRLRQYRQSTFPLIATSGLAGLTLMLIALSAPLASVAMRGGRFAVATSWSLPELLGEGGRWGLALAVLFTLLALPLLRFTSVVLLTLGVAAGRAPAFLSRFFGMAMDLGSWAMIDVFLLGASIAMIRISGWMNVGLGIGLIALTGAAVCSLVLDRNLDRARVWDTLRQLKGRANVTGQAPAAKGEPRRQAGCPRCHLVVRAIEGQRCPRCDRRLAARKHESQRRTWALLIAAGVLAIPANVLPVMTISKLGTGGTSTIMGGTLELVEHGFWPLAVLVFVASIVIPFLKIGVLASLLLSTSRGSKRWLQQRTRLYRALVLVGRWSMLDVFASAILVALARFSWVGSVKPEPGLAAFGAVVVLTMLATESFDPRLMWDEAEQNRRVAVGAPPPREATA